VEVKLKRALDLSAGVIADELTEIRNRCLRPDALEISMAVAAELIAAGIQGLVFPSVVGGTENLVVYLANCGRDALTLHNADGLISKAKRIAAKVRP
jgi:hypothetical protein